MKNTTPFLPEVSRKELEKHTDFWDYIFVVLDKYFAEIDKNGEEKFWNNVNDEQAVLMIYNYLVGQVNNGGFIQMIYNGYGNAVFDSPFIQKLQEIGLDKLIEILTEVKKLYEKYNGFEDVGRDNLEDFSKLYADCPEFETFDDKFYEIIDEQDKKYFDYIRQNLEKYTTIID